MIISDGITLRPCNVKISKSHIHPHSISVHFTNGLYPVALLFLILYMIFQHESFRSTYFYVLLLASISTPISFLTGIIEWKKKYKGVRVRIFVRKYTCGTALMGAGIASTVWYSLSPDIIIKSGVLHIVFLLLNFSILPLVAYLGYLGGKLIFGGTH